MNDTITDPETVQTEQTVQTVRCIVQLPGCDACADYVAAKDPDHRCATLCRLRLDMISNSDEGHRVHHRPLRHDCGYILSDGRGHRFSGEPVRCPFGTCTQFFCPGCRRFDMGWGVINCPCEMRRHGHGTRAEFPRRSVRHLVKGRRTRGT